MSAQTKLVGISGESTRFGFAGLGVSGLWECAFSGYDYSWNKHHYSRIAAILLGGWKDALSFDKVCHIQRIFLDQIPSLDTARISTERTFPLESAAELDIRGFVGCSGDFQAPYPVSGHKSNTFEIKYRGYSDEDINIPGHTRPEDTRKEKFDLVCGIWLADGRIFAENNEIVEQLLKLGASVAARVHNGMWWTTIRAIKDKQ